MDRRLTEAAQEGDVDQLLSLIKDDPCLMRAVSLSGAETPLHIACMRGNLQFLKEVLNVRPEFAKELNQDGFSALHIAAANGDLEIVTELLKVDCNMCMVKGKDLKIPLHYAVIKSRTEVIRELLSACEDSVREVTARGETCLHLAVKNNQFEALKILVMHLKTCNKEDILNMKDTQGDTILHIAVSRKQYEVVDLLLDEKVVTKNALEVNSLNKKGLPPLDVLLAEGGDSEIEEMLRLRGATASENTNSRPSENTNAAAAYDPSENELRGQRPRRPYKKLQDYFRYDKARDSPSEVRHTLLVIFILIVTATYQAVLNPPGGVWQDDSSPTIKTNDTQASHQHTSGRSILGTHRGDTDGLFLLFNSIGFFMSIHKIYFLTDRFPLRLELLVSLFALISTYDTCMGAIAPSDKLATFFMILSIVMPFLMPIVTWVTRDYFRSPTCVTPRTWTSARRRFSL